MNNPLPIRKTRLGFHYLPDTQHYRETDLQTWLPELVDLGAAWLVLKAPTNRAIPETFVRALIDSGIEPVLDFDFPLQDCPELSSLEPLLQAYGRWGVRSALLFDQPNARGAWPSSRWTQQDLVERFLDRYLPLAAASAQAGIIPVFPALEPGGAYWDTAFLRSALQSIDRRRQTTLLENLVVAVYAWHWDRPLNWGAGGPHRWPDARPYQPADNGQDQFGFRMFEWYSSVVEAELGRVCPLMLLQAGLSGLETGTARPLPQKNSDSLRQIQASLSIAKLLAGEPASEPDEPELPLESLPEEVVCANLWLLADDNANPTAWYRKVIAAADGQTAYEGGKGAAELKSWFASPRVHAAEIDEPEPFGKDTLPQRKSRVTTAADHPIQHYLLLPTYDFGVADWHLNIIKPYMKKHKPTVGFSVAEAALAERVTVIGGVQSIPESVIEKLREGGSLVERIDGDGTSIASILAER